MNIHASRYGVSMMVPPGQTIDAATIGINLPSGAVVDFDDRGFAKLYLKLIVRREYLLEDFVDTLSKILMTDVDTLKLPLW